MVSFWPRFYFMEFRTKASSFTSQGFFRRCFWFWQPTIHIRLRKVRRGDWEGQGDDLTKFQFFWGVKYLDGGNILDKFPRNLRDNQLCVSHTHSRFGHYFYSNLYGRAPRGPRGVKKSDLFFLQIKLLSSCAKIAPKRHKLRKLSKY